MTPAQRNAARQFLTTRVEAIELLGGAEWLLAAARAWVSDFGLVNLWWGACAMIVRAERVVGIRAIGPTVNVETLALLEEIRVAVGGSISDPDFQNPAGP